MTFAKYVFQSKLISWHQVLVSPKLILDLQGKTWLCGLCAAWLAPHIVKHARATQTSTHKARKAHTHTHSQS